MSRQTPYMPLIDSQGTSDKNEQTHSQPLLTLLRQRQIELFKKALQQPGAELSATDPLGNTVLHVAAQLGDEKAVKRILKYMVHHQLQARADQANHLGDTPLHVAARYNFPRIVDELLGQSANARHKHWPIFCDREALNKEAKKPIELTQKHWLDMRNALCLHPHDQSPDGVLLFPELLHDLPSNNLEDFREERLREYRRMRREKILTAVIASFCPGATVLTGELGGMDYFLRSLDDRWVLFRAGNLNFGLVDVLSWAMGVAFFATWIWSEHRLLSVEVSEEAAQILDLQITYARYYYVKRLLIQNLKQVEQSESEIDDPDQLKEAITKSYKQLQGNAFRTSGGDIEEGDLPAARFVKPRLPKATMHGRPDFVSRSARLTSHFNVSGLGICAAGGLGSLCQYFVVKCLEALLIDNAEEISQWAGLAATVFCLLMVLYHYPSDYRSKCQKLGDPAARMFELQEKLYYQQRADEHGNPLRADEHGIPLRVRVDNALAALDRLSLDSSISNCQGHRL